MTTGSNCSHMGTLFIVATPIGNMEDITIRALKTLFHVHIIVCEDTRKTGLLLHHLKERFSQMIQNCQELKRPNFISYHDHNEQKQLPYVLNILENGQSVALVSDAGTPLISDPGYRLVRRCIKEDIPIVCIPGPSAVLSALVVSGLPPYPFRFIGYPPEKRSKRKLLFKELSLKHKGINSKKRKETIIFFVAPHKITQIIEDLVEVYGDKELVIARELTKLHEEIFRGHACILLERFKKRKPKGEITVLLSL